MENFKEFDQDYLVPKRNFNEIIGHAFNTYFKIIGWVILLMILTIALSLAFSLLTEQIFSFDQAEMQQEMNSAIQQDGPAAMFSVMMDYPGYKESILLSSLFGMLLTPLYLGIIYLMHKANMGRKTSFADVFEGFKKNIFQIIIYAIISGIAMMVGLAFCGIGIFFVIPFFFLGYPVLLFENATAMEAIRTSVNIGKENYGLILGVSAISLLIAVAGVVVCLFGVLATFGFYYAAMYSTYIAFRNKEVSLPYQK